MTTFYGVKGRRGIVFPARGQKLAVLKEHFSGLTPILLTQIRPFEDKCLNDKIIIHERPVKVPKEILENTLDNITHNSSVLVIEKGSDFNVINNGDPRTVEDVVGIMQQIFSTYESPVPYILNGGKHDHVMNEARKEARSVSVWLDKINPDKIISDEINKEIYHNTVGLFMSLNRFFETTLDHIDIVIPLGMTIVDQKIAG